MRYQLIAPSKLFAAALFATLLNVVIAINVGVANERQTNFIFVSCDNLGYGDIEPFGSTLHRTPNLNRMAVEGRKLTHFYVSSGVCTPSRASLMTGCYAQRVGMHVNDRDDHVLRPISPYGLDPGEVTVAEILKDQGYATAIVGKWHLGDQPAFLPTRQGFDWFFGVPYSDDMVERVWERDGSHWPPLPLMENETVIEAPVDRDGLTKRYTERAMQWIEQHKDEPFFLYFAQAMPGSTKAPFASPAFKGKSKNGPWGDAIEELDWSMGVMLDQLVELGIAENTLVIWTSDNGAPSIPGDPSRGTNRPLYGRGYQTSEGGFRVPTIAWQPGKVPAGTVCDELISTMDVLPTFATLAGGSVPTDRKIDGHNATALLYGDAEAKSDYEAFFYYNRDQLQAVRSGPWKLFLPIDPLQGHPHFVGKVKPHAMLFNLVTDIGSTMNVAGEHPEVVERLSRFADQARTDLGDLGLPGNGQRGPGKIPQGQKPIAQVMTKNALNVIEETRGGRHWVDSETAAPKAPADSLAAMKTEPGFDVQLFASEPLVMDPVAITFDEQGRMFVVEYGDYPIGPEDGGDPLSRIVMLQDSDGDGAADQRVVFADKLDFAHSMMSYDGGLLVGAKTQILYLEDTNGDDIADVREVMFDGFTPAHPQMQIGCPQWGIDNWVYLNYGPGKVTSAARPDVAVELPRKDFRFHPDTMEFQPDSGLGQFGNTIDRWGNRFYCSNRNPIMTTFLAPSVTERNPYHIADQAHYDVGDAGGDTKVFPLVSMKSNYLSHAGTHTSACGTTAYTGDLSSGDVLQSVFVCEPIGHLVTRSIVRPDGLRLRAQRAQPGSDFIASTDTWFRPSSLANGPDGALYLADMYRLWVEHPKFLPPEIAAKLDWRAGEDRGRIYRIVPKDAIARDPFVPPKNDADNVRLLTDSNGWRQFLGQRLLVRGKSVDRADDVRKLLNHSQATTRLHALWTLDGLSSLRPEDVISAIGDTDPHVRIAALQLAPSWIGRDDVFKEVLKIAGDDDVRVRLAVGLALSGNSSAMATEALGELALRDGDDPWFADGLLTSLKERSGDVLHHLITDSSFVSHGSPSRTDLIRKLAAVIGARGDSDELARLFELLTEEPSGVDWWRAAAISGLGQGLPRHRGELGRMTLSRMLSDPPESLARSTEGLKRFFERIDSVAVNSDRSLVDRTAAVEVMGYQPLDQVRETFGQLLASGQSVEIQAACIDALRQNGSAGAAEIVLDRWNQLGPTVRSSALELLLRRVDSIQLTLAAMKSGAMQASALSLDQRVRLLGHGDDSIRKQANELFGGAVSADRAKVAKQYEASLSLAASATEGAKVFQKTCANCHRYDGQGHVVGPDLTDLRNRSKPAILYDILDPNSKVEPRYTPYSVLTIDGNVFAGLVESETAESIVLTMPEGKKQTIGRAQIEQLRVSDVSMMPEGIEKDIPLQAMADLLEFLKSP